MAECGFGCVVCERWLFFLNTLNQSLLVEFGRHGLEDLLGQTVLELLDGDGAVGVRVHGVEEGVEVELGLQSQHLKGVLDLVPRQVARLVSVQLVENLEKKIKIEYENKQI